MNPSYQENLDGWGVKVKPNYSPPRDANYRSGTCQYCDRPMGTVKDIERESGCAMDGAPRPVVVAPCSRALTFKELSRADTTPQQFAHTRTKDRRPNKTDTCKGS